MSREQYAEFVRNTTPHLLLSELRPVLGVRRWVVDSRAYDTFRPVVVWGTEIRARKRAQARHAAHARARHAIAIGLDADLAGTGPVRREYRLIYRDDPALQPPDPDGAR